LLTGSYARFRRLAGAVFAAGFFGSRPRKGMPVLRLQVGAGDEGGARAEQLGHAGNAGAVHRPQAHVIVGAVLKQQVALPVRREVIDRDELPSRVRVSQPGFDCRRRSVHQPARIDGCTRTIASGKYQGKNLAWAYSNRGIAYFRNGDVEHSIADFTEAIALDPKVQMIYQNRCAAYRRKRDLDHAIADCSQALALDAKFGSPTTRAATPISTRAISIMPFPTTRR
jgi:tetratricopeptide (TPR) repeat protein